MGIVIISVGKIKERFYREAIEEYTKRLSKYCRLECRETADEKTPENASPLEEMKIKEKEAERILKYVKEDTYVIALDIQGGKVDSPAFSRKIEGLFVQGKSNLAFIIGGSLGLHPLVLQRADETISFSDMTFPHQLMKVILLEQIYRGYRIMNHEPYHK